MTIDPRQLDELRYIDLALAEAERAVAKGEVPVGAIIVGKTGEVLGSGHNLKESSQDPTAHAEIIALRDAAKKIGGWRLDGATLFATLEPCPMCLGAILQARVDRVIFLAKDKRWGACGTVIDFSDRPYFNHVTQIEFREDMRSQNLLTNFFRRLRSA